MGVCVEGHNGLVVTSPGRASGWPRGGLARESTLQPGGGQCSFQQRLSQSCRAKSEEQERPQQARGCETHQVWRVSVCGCEKVISHHSPNSVYPNSLCTDAGLGTNRRRGG